MTFTDFVCLLLGGGARSAVGGRAEPTAGEKTAEAPRANTKTLRAGANAPARSPLIKTLS